MWLHVAELHARANPPAPSKEPVMVRVSSLVHAHLSCHSSDALRNHHLLTSELSQLLF